MLPTKTAENPSAAVPTGVGVLFSKFLLSDGRLPSASIRWPCHRASGCVFSSAPWCLVHTGVSWLTHRLLCVFARFHVLARATLISELLDGGSTVVVPLKR